MTTSRITCAAERRHRLEPRFARRDDVDAAVHRAAAGDARAWELIVRRFDATIRAVARRHGLNEADRDEVAQRTWLALVRHIGRLEGHPALGGWLALTARRECLRLLARARRESLVDSPLEDVADDVSLEDQIELRERSAALRGAIDRAPAHERRIMRLLLEEPAAGYDDVSAILGIPKGSIGPTRGRCIARLRGDHALARAVGRRPPGHDLE